MAQANDDTSHPSTSQLENTFSSTGQKVVERMDGTAQTEASYVDMALAPQWLAGVHEIPEVTRYKETSYQLLGLQPGMTVLDLGCGIGDDAAELLPFVQPGGSVIGVDVSSDMISQAYARHPRPATYGRLGKNHLAPAPPHEGLQFRVGPAEGIPLPDDICDAVRVDRMLQHVGDPLIVLKEIERVLHPEGKLLLVEPDWRTMAIHPGSKNGGDDDHVLQAVLEWQIAHTRHPLMGRQLRAWLQQAAFTDIQVMPVAYSSTSFGVIRYVLELSAAGEAAAAATPPLISEEDVQDWFRAAEQAETSGEFYSTVVLYFGLAHKRAQVIPPKGV